MTEDDQTRIAANEWWNDRRIVASDALAGAYLLMPPDRDVILAALARLQAENSELHTLKSEVFDNPAKWMRWCDHKVLERCEALEADKVRLQAERDELSKQIAIFKLSVPLEEELSGKIDEMLKYLAMGQGFTLSGIARLFMECQRRMAADWSDVGNERRQRKAAEAARTEALQQLDLATDAVNALNNARLAAEDARDEAQRERDEARRANRPQYGSEGTVKR